MKVWQLWLPSVIMSVLLTEIVVAIMSLLLEGEVSPDYLLTGLVASGFVSSLIIVMVSRLVGKPHESEERFRVQVAHICSNRRKCRINCFQGEANQPMKAKLQYNEDRFEAMCCSNMPGMPADLPIDELTKLASHIQEAKEEERLRIAREIHDEIGSLLTAIRIDFSWLSQRLPKGNQLLVDKAAAITELLNKTITSAGNLAQSLRPGFLDDFGIITAIEIEAQEFSARSGVSCTIIKSEEAIDLPEAATISLFRIFQETLNNIMKHAQAKNVQIEIVKGEDHLELVILDDGVGFTEEARNKPRSFGLRGIHERVAHLGGTVKIASKPNGGTQIAICIPLDAESTLQESAQQQLFARYPYSD